MSSGKLTQRNDAVRKKGKLPIVVIGKAKKALIRECIPIAERLEEFGLPLPYVRWEGKQAEIRPDGRILVDWGRFYRLGAPEDATATIPIGSLKKMLNNGRRRLLKAEGDFEKICAKFPGLVAECIFEGTETGKKWQTTAFVLNRKLADVAQQFKEVLPNMTGYLDWRFGIRLREKYRSINFLFLLTITEDSVNLKCNPTRLYREQSLLLRQFELVEKTILKQKEDIFR